MEQKIISDKNEILQLLRQVLHNKLLLYLRTGLNEYLVKLLRIKDDSLIIDGGGYYKRDTEYINFYLLYEENIYSGQLKIRDTTHMHEFQAQIPDVLFERKQRKYKRISTEKKVTCSFKVISQSGPSVKENISIPFFMRNIYNELNKETPDVKKIFTMVLEEVKKVSPASDVKFYKKDEKLNLIDQTISKFKKALYIQDTHDVRNYMIGYNSPFYMSYGELFQSKIKENGWDQEQITNAAATIMAKDKSLNRLSYVYIPILKFGDIVGHLYSAYSIDSNKKFAPKNVLFLKALTDIISEALTKNILFKSDEGEAPKIKVDNISRGGMKFSIYDTFLLKFLQKGVHLYIMANIEDKPVTLTGEILRINKQLEGVGLGIKFIEIKPADDKIIKDFVEESATKGLFD